MRKVIVFVLCEKNKVQGTVQVGIAGSSRVALGTTSLTAQQKMCLQYVVTMGRFLSHALPEVCNEGAWVALSSLSKRIARRPSLPPHCNAMFSFRFCPST